MLILASFHIMKNDFWDLTFVRPVRNCRECFAPKTNFSIQQTMSPRSKLPDLEDGHPIYDLLVHLYEIGQISADKNPSEVHHKYEELEDNSYSTA